MDDDAAAPSIRGTGADDDECLRVLNLVLSGGQFCRTQMGKFWRAPKWFCLCELRLTLLASGTEHVIVARGAGFDRLLLPPHLATTHWPNSGETAAIATMVRRELAKSTGPIRTRLCGAALINARSILEESATPQPLPLDEIPHFGDIPLSIRRRFVGRADDLARIHFNLHTLQKSSTAVTGRVTAAGGFGKTRLVAEYLHRFGPRFFPGGLFWITANRPSEGFDEQLHGILRSLDRDSLDLASIHKLELSVGQMIADALAKNPSPVLIVVDDLPEPSPGCKPISLAVLSPLVGRATILATSRHDPKEPFVTTLEIGVLSRNSAVALLTHDLEISEEMGEADWQKICEWVGDLPIALSLLNLLLGMGAVSPQDLVSRARTRVDPHTVDHYLDAIRGQVPDGALRGIAETFSLSLASLGDSAAHAAKAYAFLAHAPVPHELLSHMTMGHLRLPENKVILKSRHFVEASSTDFLGPMHPVLASFLSRQMGASAQMIFIADGLKRVITPAALNDDGQRSVAMRCVPHAEALFDRLVRRDPPEIEILADNLCDLGALASWAYSSINDFKRGEDLARLAIDFFDSLKYGSRLMGPEVRIAVPPASVILAKGALALALMGQHAYAEALTALDECLVWARSQRQPVELSISIEVLVGRATLGIGHVKRAARLLDRWHTIANDQTVDKALRAMTLALSAETLLATGGIQAALKAGEEQLESCREWFGERHAATLGAMTTLSGICMHARDYERAMDLNDRALLVCANLHGRTHTNYYALLGNAAYFMSHMGRLEDASRVIATALEGESAILGDDHPVVAVTLCQKAEILVRLGQVSDGALNLDHAVAVLTNRLGANHPLTLRTLQNVAFVRLTVGDLAGADPAAVTSYSGRVRTLGENHPDTIRAAYLLAQVRIARADIDGAEQILYESRGHCRRTFGAEHIETIRMSKLLSEVRHRQSWNSRLRRFWAELIRRG